MDLSLWGEFINSVGFPIFVTVILLYNNQRTSDMYAELYRELKVTIDNNTRVTEELKSIIIGKKE